MNELAKEWVKALRSGEYPQGYGALCSPEGWCCLGVAHDIAHDGYWYLDDSGYFWVAVDKHHSSICYPPMSTLDAVGITYEQGNIIAGMNDDEKTFPEIADEIERILR